MSKASDHWGTPSHILRQVRRFWPGGVDLDPCSNERSIVAPRVEYMEPDDAKRQPWSGLARGEPFVAPHHPLVEVGPIEGAPVRCYMNPPFSAPAWWFEQIHRESLTGLLDGIAMIHVATSTRWWQNHVWPATAVCFLHQRPAFLDGNGEPASGNRYDCAMPYYGPERWRFAQIFSEIGVVR